MRILTIVFLAIIMNACAHAKLPTVSHVNVEEYVGKWYAVYSLPQIFTLSCVAQTAEYKILDASSISVLNTCFRKDGSQKTIVGKAVVANPATNAELIVTFDNFWTKLFHVKGEYNILKLDESYSTVLVGSMNPTSLWILSRTPYISDEVKKEYFAYAKQLGFDTSKLVESKF